MGAWRQERQGGGRQERQERQGGGRQGGGRQERQERQGRRETGETGRRETGENSLKKAQNNFIYQHYTKWKSVVNGRRVRGVCARLERSTFVLCVCVCVCVREYLNVSSPRLFSHRSNVSCAYSMGEHLWVCVPDC